MTEAFDIKSFKGITQDSRAVKKGYFFAALPGTRTSGVKFVPDALANGARGLLISSDETMPEDLDLTGITVIRDAQPKRKLAELAAAFYGAQPACIVAVTGTNGKTSTVTFAQQIWQMLDLRSASLGTLGLRGAGTSSVRTTAMTTPDPISLHAELADLAAVGITHLAMEASSHGLDQFRLDGVHVRAAGFTNLSRDHLDYHADMEEYLKAKTRLFTDVMKRGGTAVLNADVPEFESLAKLCKSAGHRVLSYGANGEDLKILGHEPTGCGQEISLRIFGKTHELVLPLVGHFQLMNVLCAAGLVLAEDAKLTDRVVACLAELKGAPGRLELVSGHPSGAAIYVDYAHTPDALLNVLQALRPHTHGRLVCLFGCGGDRDAGKRPVMGEIASKHADHVIVTDDNPRSENPQSIRSAILKGAPGAQEIPGRRAAIRAAVADLTEGDVLVIAGKGHEQGQVFADHTEPFDDVEEATIAAGGVT